MIFYKQTNVFEESLNRIRYIFSEFEEVAVSMSGGKDSTVILELALIVAREQNKLPLKVFWLDQEAEWEATVRYMKAVFGRPEIKPYWYQIPFNFTNALSHSSNFITVWGEQDQANWIRPKDDISIKVNPTKEQRFHPLIQDIGSYLFEPTTTNAAILVGLKMNESLTRRTLLTGQKKGKYKDITWCSKKHKNYYRFFPIYDWEDSDIWTAIAKNKWEYNIIYDLQYQYGVARKDMRLSALIHETSWHSIEMLQEFEPKTYDRFVNRVKGVGTFKHLFDQDGTKVKDLPFMFKDWKEYRDYLLQHIVKPEYIELFQNRWKKQDGEDMYKVHVKELLVNDIDGTINGNARANLRNKAKGVVKHEQNIELLKQYLKEKEND